ncbi:MAG: type VI secretion system baseplate subunit TssK [Bryobacteraceae bacterium]|nr:type VI secretion system baseplate subunit TssK [Bryobacteraceae bacterium]
MKILQPVIWSKGTFLSPQHLQAQDRFLESILQFRLEALRYEPWGFSRLEIDQEKLSNGGLAIHRAAGLFPDGLAFEIPESDPAPPLKPLNEFFGPDQQSIDVYLAVPDFRPSGVNLSAPERDLDTRYLAAVGTFRDENSGASERAIQLARKNFRLLVEGEPRRGSVPMRVARVRRLESGTLQLDPRFAPPLTDFTASEYLAALARRLVEALAAKSGMLAGMRRQKNQSLAEFTTADIANFWLLYTINSHFPGLRHLLETRHGHPEELFSILASLASTLTTFSLELQPRDLPPYLHDALGDCFGKLDEQLTHLLDTVVPSNFVSLPLRLVRPSIYAASLFEDRFLENTRLYLAIKAEMDEGELIRRAPQLVKVCSAAHIEHLVRQALPGIPMTHVMSPPTSIPVKLNHQYFSLSRSGLAWEAVERARNLAAYIPGDFPNPEAELIVLLPQES